MPCAHHHNRVRCGTDTHVCAPLVELLNASVPTARNPSSQTSNRFPQDLARTSLLDSGAMKSIILRTLCAVLFVASCAAAQETIPLYPGDGTPPNSTPENYPEKAYFSKLWNTDVVSNVTKPSLTVFKPSAETKNGTAAIICPGGGFMALSITSEGTDVAKYLTERGVTTFVLKYRLAHTGEDATQEFADAFADREKLHQTIGKVIPLSIADGAAAIAYVKQHAAEFGVSPDRVGIIGFSAGGTVAVGA